MGPFSPSDFPNAPGCPITFSIYSWKVTAVLRGRYKVVTETTMEFMTIETFLVSLASTFMSMSGIGEIVSVLRHFLQ